MVFGAESESVSVGMEMAKRASSVDEDKRVLFGIVLFPQCLAESSHVGPPNSGRRSMFEGDDAPSEFDNDSFLFLRHIFELIHTVREGLVFVQSDVRVAYILKAC